MVSMIIRLSFVATVQSYELDEPVSAFECNEDHVQILAKARQK